MEKPLEFLIRKPKVSLEKPPLLLLLHGVGSNEEDLFSLSNFLPDSFLVVSLRGPLKLGPGSFGWYEVLFTTGQPKINLEQEAESRKLLLQFLEYLKINYQFDESNVWIGGFSQGAIMSYSIGLLHPEKVKGIIALSGRLLEENKIQVKVSEKILDKKIFISHGTNDRVLSVEYARSVKGYLESIGLHPHYQEYEEGHSINREMLKDLIQWLEVELGNHN
ncbi:esterase [Leptospira sp. 2 VSF19]|uniref:Esterase n=1 Tax=Leptospira soteropolitanensis TaxID=2950025 RepID=A0AAW5VJ19_9LEPT|nr:esterase [Leptospira soteropolitanensis]MCW7491595.1 esterase [Leptospira soteropolitanensis]MCW7499179.1 esterase [Leptospira soteropolitanensis]MCW7521229.1 esterase [Leptospira soteropolitanensis]MCW7525283.1 esterase [Leptospira soteropolitanensis]MCW7529150.1 esterase [Leptospira soteropolitanensis]